MPTTILYARKSSESEDRQVRSIDSQVRELKEHATTRGFTITRILSEARSAKAPGRPVFGEMMEAIGRGNADSILCWKLDRLARNPVDGAALIWALDQGKLQQIETRERVYVNRSDDKLWMQLEFGMAKKYVDDLSDNTKRGLRAKLEQGWMPGIARLGYLNDPITKTQIPDATRFPLVRRIFDLLLAGRAPMEVFTIARNDWGLRMRKFKKIGGGPLSRTAFYRIISDPGYYGMNVWNGVAYPGAHEPMLSKDEFDRVQNHLGRPNRKHHKRYLFAYTGLIRCGECGAAVTAEEKVNRYGSRYVYYHCTKRLPGVRCSQRVIQDNALDNQINEWLGTLHVDDAFRDWAIRQLTTMRGDEARSARAIAQSRNEAAQGIQKHLDALLDIRLRGLLSDDEFARKKEALVSEQLRLRAQIAEERENDPSWFEPARRAIMFANLAPKRFAASSREEKREVLIAVGSNPVLTDRILRIQPKKPFHLMAERPGLFAQLRD